MHALYRSCEVQQETSELAQHGRAHGDMADLPLYPPVAQPFSPPAADEDLNVAVGYRIGVVQGRTSSGLGKAMRRGMRCWHQPRLPPPLCMSRANISRALLTGTSIPHSLLRRSSFWGLRLKEQSPPPTALRLFFSPYEEERRKTESEKAKKEAVTRPKPQTSIIGGGWGGEAWSQNGCSKVPSCLLKRWEVSMSIQILLMWWERTISQASLWIICTPNTASHVVFSLAFSNLTSTTHVFNCILSMATWDCYSVHIGGSQMPRCRKFLR